VLAASRVRDDVAAMDLRVGDLFGLRVGLRVQLHARAADNIAARVGDLLL
jgi:hypothetical protein